MSRNNSLLFFAAALTNALNGPILANHEPLSRPKVHNLNQALDYYGYRSDKQKQAVRYLYRLSGVNDIGRMFDEETFDDNQLAAKITDFVGEGQSKFVRRKNDQERWHVGTEDWMREPANHTGIANALNTLNLLEGRLPAQQDVDAVCILGATKKTMENRLNYAHRLLGDESLDMPKYLLLLAGERYVTLGVDGSEEELQQIARRLHFKGGLKDLTESDILIDLYRNSDLYALLDENFDLIDTPRNDLPRPTTETTVRKLCEWLRAHPNVRSIVFISNQPHVDYQEAIISQVFAQENITVSFEVVGSEHILADDKSRSTALAALGSTLFATTPIAIRDLKLNISDRTTINKLLELYGNQKLILSELEKYFDFKIEYTPKNKFS